MGTTMGKKSASGEPQTFECLVMPVFVVTSSPISRSKMKFLSQKILFIHLKVRDRCRLGMDRSWGWEEGCSETSPLEKAWKRVNLIYGGNKHDHRMN